MEFGRMGKGCKEAMFWLIDEGSAFKHGDHFIDELCDQLITKLHM